MRMVCYNIQYGTGKDGRIDLGRIAADIGEADIICLQEVERYCSVTGDTDQAAAFAALFPDHYWIYGGGVDTNAATPDDRGRRRQFGNMILSRWPILSSRNHLLPKILYIDQLALQRSAVEGVIETPLGAIRVYSVHLGHVGAAERRAQIKALMEIVFASPERGGVISGRKASAHWTADAPLPPMPAPAVLMGDFNLAPEDAEYELLVGGENGEYGRLTTTRLLIDAWAHLGNPLHEGHTCFEHFGRSQRIDYAFLTPDIAGRARAVTVDAGAEGSDHQPLALDLA
jgi:endonuclease/exonuclease/phosphatase family metal-dependent hydrolase